MTSLQERFRRTSAELENLTQAVREIAETVVSDDGLVTVTAGARGELRELRLDPRIYRTTDSAALADTVIRTIWAAQRQVSAQLVELVSPVLGNEVNGVALADQLSRIPDTEAADR